MRQIVLAFLFFMTLLLNACKPDKSISNHSYETEGTSTILQTSTWQSSSIISMHSSGTNILVIKWDSLESSQIAQFWFLQGESDLALPNNLPVAKVASGENGLLVLTEGTRMYLGVVNESGADEVMADKLVNVIGVSHYPAVHEEFNIDQSISRSNTIDQLFKVLE